MTPAPELVDRFRRDLAALWPRAFKSDACLGLAVSGGGDSLALLLLAHAALSGRIAAATVDHGLRPESADEAAMVAATCRALAVPHATLAVTLAPGNMQDRARRARYAALAEWCEREGLNALAIAHQLDDQAETLAMRLNRGSGLAGLAGVRACGSIAGADLPVLRPLLGWRRAELAAVVEGAGLEAVRDPANTDDRFDRARIRKALATAEWLDPTMLARSAALLGEAESYVAERIDGAFAERVSAVAGGLRLVPGRSDFEAVELATRAVAELGSAAARSEVATMVERLRRGENASLGGVLARADNGHWIFTPEPPRASPTKCC